MRETSEAAIQFTQRVYRTIGYTPLYMYIYIHTLFYILHISYTIEIAGFPEIWDPNSGTKKATAAWQELLLLGARFFSARRDSKVSPVLPTIQVYSLYIPSNQ